MAEGGVCKRFLVLDERSGRKCMIQFKDYQTFDQACKKKFGYPQDKGVIFVLEDDQDIELDESAFECYKDNTQFRIRPIADETPNTGNTEHTGETDEDNTKIENSSDSVENDMNMDQINDEMENIDNRTILEDVKKAYKRGGIKDVYACALQSLNQWKDIPINIGVTGNSGVGKSSFINALRGLTPTDAGAAATGVVETTVTPTPYKHPSNDKMLLWDLPGVGTPNFLQQKYLAMIDVDRYDYFIILSSTRFTENDMWLGNELKKRKKRFYFVRTKIGDDIRNDRRNFPHKHDTKILLDSVRDNCQRYLYGLVTDVYIIDNYETNHYDFQRLSEAIITDAPELKRDSVLFTLICSTSDILKLKRNKCLKRIPLLALLPGCVGAASTILPTLDIYTNISVIVGECTFYKRQFGLTDEALKHTAELNGTSIESLKRDLKLDFTRIEFTTKGIKAGLATLGRFNTATYMAATTLSSFVPIFGNIVGATSSYTYCTTSLLQLLVLAYDDANTLSNFVLRKV